MYDKYDENQIEDVGSLERRGSTERLTFGMHIRLSHLERRIYLVVKSKIKPFFISLNNQKYRTVDNRYAVGKIKLRKQ